MFMYKAYFSSLAGHFSQEGFLKFLMSEDNNLIPAEYLDLSQDMTQPISHYFINSSHNTYLTGETTCALELIVVMY